SISPEFRGRQHLANCERHRQFRMGSPRILGFLGIGFGECLGEAFRAIYRAGLMRQPSLKFYADERGGVLVEATVTLLVFFAFVFGSVDFLMAMYQWNAATKAVQMGARIAAVSSPVSVDVATMTGLGPGVNPGDPMPGFSRTCNVGGSGTCDVGNFD